MSTEQNEDELIQKWLNKIPLELVILIAALGHAFLIYDKVVLLVGEFVPRPVLLISCIAAEFLVARAGTWGWPGVAMSTFMVITSIIGILFIHELLHVYFGILILTGVTGQYVRSELTRKQDEATLKKLNERLVTITGNTTASTLVHVDKEGTLYAKDLVGITVAELGRRIGIAYHRAQKAKKLLDVNGKLTLEDIEQLKV